MNPFTIRNHLGAPTFFKNGKPIFPLLFWQTEILDRDAQAFSESGVEIYSFFRSDWKHPFWIGEGQYDFSLIDSTIREFHRKLPLTYCIPRIYVGAPYWWLEKNPEELCGYAVAAPYTRDDGRWQGSFHQSFASEKWKKEMGEAFRQLIRHMVAADYGECVIGIHICNGITGEWHRWAPQLYSDTSICMEKRYGRPIPPPEKRDADYYRCLHEATADAIEHFARIVKEESDYLTAVFYGYTPDMPDKLDWSIAGDHRAAALVHRLPDIDIFSAPHSYARRRAGEDGYFRNFPASIALHGKLFIDEGDDRTYLDGREGNGFAHVGGPAVPADVEGSLQIIRREFGNMLTHNIGMWYMDLNGGWFHDDRIMAEIARLKKWGDHSMRLPRTRSAEIAVIASADSEFHLPPRGKPGNEKYASRYIQQIGELCKTGAPFDFYVAEDLESDIMERYRVIFCLDGLALSPDKRERLHELQCKGRTFLWFHDTGAIIDGKRSSVNSSELTGLDMSGAVPQDPVKREFPDWTSIDLGDPVIAAETLREIFRTANVHIYADSGDVVSASDSALMIHASTAGEKTVRLPKPCRITDLVSGTIQENTQIFSLTMQVGETALFLTEK